MLHGLAELLPCCAVPCLAALLRSASGRRTCAAGTMFYCELWVVWHAQVMKEYVGTCMPGLTQLTHGLLDVECSMCKPIPMSICGGCTCRWIGDHFPHRV